MATSGWTLPTEPGSLSALSSISIHSVPPVGQARFWALGIQLGGGAAWGASQPRLMDWTDRGLPGGDVRTNVPGCGRAHPSPHGKQAGGGGTPPTPRAGSQLQPGRCLSHKGGCPRVSSQLLPSQGGLGVRSAPAGRDTGHLRPGPSARLECPPGLM